MLLLGSLTISRNVRRVLTSVNERCGVVRPDTVSLQCIPNDDDRDDNGAWEEWSKHGRRERKRQSS